MELHGAIYTLDRTHISSVLHPFKRRYAEAA